MSYHSYKKPENALRRAQELYNAGKKQLGIEILNSVLNQRRHKQWTTTHEELIKLYLKICVDLRKKMFARDGLYQYRSLCQREAPGSLEVVVNHLIDLAEEKCVEAMALAGNRVKLSELVADDSSNPSARSQASSSSSVNSAAVGATCRGMRGLGLLAPLLMASRPLASLPLPAMLMCGVNGL